MQQYNLIDQKCTSLGLVVCYEVVKILIIFAVMIQHAL